ncbi:hypothetical protein RHGRI_021397 [Rhododendron griersonianum]|uniref:Uncharacterized protein n=1 Tax=Rhododendron griersonianum TaxID=479676 RepID=A0AAV6JQD1_9ERIC|nr:hypothetical protein RHGRI_021397 [Rhododendron griersonianum]
MATESRVPFILAAIASAIPVFLSGYYLTHTVILFIRGDPDCSHPRSKLDLGFAIFAFLLFLVGSIGVVWRLKTLQIICMVTLVITVVLILAVGMNILPGDQARYRLDKYPRWAKNFILNDNDWGVFQRIPENSQGNGSNPQVNVQSLSRQLAQVLSNLEDEAAQELITLLRRVVAPPSVVGVDANGVIHEQVNHDDVPRQAPQVYSNPTFESNMIMHNQPFVGPTALRSTVRPTSFFQNIPSVYEVGNSSGYSQNVNLNHGRSPRNGFTGNHAVNNGPYAYSMAPNMPSNGNYANQTAQTLPNNGNNNGSYVQITPNKAGILRYLLHIREDFRGSLQLEHMVTHGIMSLNPGKEWNLPKFRTWFGLESKGRPVYQSKHYPLMDKKQTMELELA